MHCDFCQPTNRTVDFLWGLAALVLICSCRSNSPASPEAGDAAGSHPIVVTGVDVRVVPEGWGTIHQLHLGSSRILLKAVPDSRDHAFDHWTGIASSQNPTVILGSTTTSVAAVFTNPLESGQEPSEDVEHPSPQVGDEEVPVDDPDVNPAIETPPGEEVGNPDPSWPPDDSTPLIPIPGNWENPNDFFLALDSEGELVIETAYEFDSTGNLREAKLRTTVEEFTSGLHRIFAGGSPGLAIVVDQFNATIDAGKPTTIWSVRVVSEFFGDVELNTQISYHAFALSMGLERDVIWEFDVERIDSVQVGGSAFTTTYHYAGTQTGALAEDEKSMVWLARQGSVSIDYDPPCESGNCVEWLDLGLPESPLSGWSRGEIVDSP